MYYMFLPLVRFFDFSGRSGRREFWMFTLLTFLVLGISMILLLGSAGVLDPSEVEPDDVGQGFLSTLLIVLCVWIVGILIPTIAVTIRRLHDLGLSGWWFLGSIIAGMIPYVGILVTIGFWVVMALPGNHGSNRFGSEPE